MGIIMNIKHIKQNHITFSLVLLGALSMSFLLPDGLLQPREAAAGTITCSAGVSGCHFTPTVKDGTARNVPGGRFTGSHAKHSGYSTSSAKGQYLYACTRCHPSAAYNNSHQTGFKNITGSSLPGNRYSAGKKIANTNTPVFGNCSQIYCHSTGRSAAMGQIRYSSARWGGTKTCLGCHGGRASATGAPARSVGNFTLSTSHSQHLKYPAANINCQICHAKTTQTDAWTLKNYTAASHHVNGVREVEFTNIAYASYTSYKTSGVNINKCTNTSCHGGLSRSAWSASAQNTNHTCTHCHGVGTGVSSGMSVTGTNRYNLRYFAPGWNKTGTSTDQTNSSNNIRVGSHFKHLSSAYMKNIKCNECHQVPYTPFQAGSNHTLNTTRFNSGTLTFAQASSARWNGVTATQLAAFAGYTNGTAVKAATCSSVYCHGSRLKNGDTAGSVRTPYWNYSAMINYTNRAQACGRCHGNPPTSVSAQHNGKAATTSCSGCHGSVVNSTGAIINKALHINGNVEATSGHAFPYPGATHSIATGATNPASNCSCHDYTNTGSYPVAAGIAPNCKACHTVGLLRTVATSSCYDCHGSTATNGTPNGGTAFPNWSGSHKTHVTGQSMACAECHANGGTGNTNHGHSNRTAKNRTTVNVSGSDFTYTAGTQTCSSVTCHGTAVWSVTQFNCVTCHGSSINAPNYGAGKTRRAISTEFGANWSHVNTAGSVAKEDCGVCHMEGSPTTGSTVSPYHGNGVIELRDADTGTTITNFSGATYTFGRFSTTFITKATNATTNNTDYIVALKFCLKCHDVGGAGSTSARRTGGTATKPFGTAGGTVIDADTQFATTNASAHPVKGPRQNNYCNTNTMNVPYRVTKTAGSTTLTNGVVITCWDCHNTSTGSKYTVRTIDAHGSGATASILRGIYSNTNEIQTFCTACHTNYTTYANSAATYPHGTRGNMQNAGISGMCKHCHSGTPTEARPERAKSVHGFNTRATAYPSGQRPFAFLRNTQVFVDWKPKQTGTTVNTSFGCSLSSSGDSNGQGCTHSAMSSFYGGTFSSTPTSVYGPGGIYPNY